MENRNFIPKVEQNPLKDNETLELDIMESVDIIAAEQDLKAKEAVMEEMRKIGIDYTELEKEVEEAKRFLEKISQKSPVNHTKGSRIFLN